MTDKSEWMLQIRDLNVYYGAIHALRGISVNVAPGEIVTLIGANGGGEINASAGHFFFGKSQKAEPSRF